MELSVLNIEGKDTGKKVSLPAEVFAIEPNDHVIYLSVKQYLANQRQGTHKAKERAEVALSTRKIKRQKGTGGARAGSLKAPVFVGGGRIFGPRPRNYGFKLNKKVKLLAKYSAYTYKAREAAITVVEDFGINAPKTKEYIRILSNLSLSGKKTLLILPEANENVYRSARNLPKTSVTTVDSVNTYEILNADTIILCESSVAKINA